jgi:hypothetical protein
MENGGDPKKIKNKLSYDLAILLLVIFLTSAYY